MLTRGRTLRRLTSFGGRLLGFPLLAIAVQDLGDHHRDRRQKDVQVKTDGPVVDVQEVQPAIGVKRWVVSCLELPEAGDARFDVMATQQFGVELCDLLGEGGTGSHQAHCPGEDIEELGKFVDAQRAHDCSDSRNSRVV